VTASQSEVLNLASLVDYQTAAVVSRSIVKTEMGSITLFAFDEGQELSEHTSPFDAFVQVLEGRVEIGVAGRAHTVESGGALLLPAGAGHWLKAAGKFKMLLTMIRA
jgi:quercetin dioxygenase-like cupin family protein